MRACQNLADSGYEAAEPVLRRIAGVINFTEFAVPTSEQTIGVNLRSGLAQLQSDDDEKAIIARGCARREKYSLASNLDQPQIFN